MRARHALAGCALIAMQACGPRMADPGVIEVTAVAMPAEASIARDTAGVIFEVRARNTLAERVRVQVRDMRPGAGVAMTGENAAEAYGIVFGARVAAHRGASGGHSRALYNTPGERMVLTPGPGSFSATTVGEAGGQGGVVEFAPSEVKIRRFVMKLDTLPGSYMLVGSFITREAGPVILRVAP